MSTAANCRDSDNPVAWLALRLYTLPVQAIFQSVGVRTSGAVLCEISAPSLLYPQKSERSANKNLRFKMIKTLYLIAALLVPSVSRAAPENSSFGIPHEKEMTPDLRRYVNDTVLPSEFHKFNPKFSIDDIFRLRPSMPKDGDRGPRGRDYFDTISSKCLFRELQVQADSKGIHTISFRNGINNTCVQQIDQIVLWLLTLFGDPAEAFTRDLSSSQAGDELIALSWKKDGATVVLTFHFAQFDPHVYSMLCVCRSGTATKQIIDLSKKTDIKTAAKPLQDFVHAWSTTLAKLPEIEPAGSGKPTTKPTDEPPAKDQPVPPTSKDAPR